MFLNTFPVRELRKIVPQHKVGLTNGEEVALVWRITLHIIESVRVGSWSVEIYFNDITDEKFPQFLVKRREVYLIPFPSMQFLEGDAT